MAGAFSAIMDLVGLAGKIDDNADVTELAKALNNTKSITERARKSIFVYPVLFSSGMAADLDASYDVAKFLELQYGVFTLMTVGLNPSVENGNIDQYLNTISAESVENISCEMVNINPNQVNSWYNMFSEENKDFFEEYNYIHGTEAKTFGNNQKLAKEIKDLKDEVEKQNKDTKEAIKRIDANSKSKADIPDPFSMDDETIYSEGSQPIGKWMDKLSSGSPTMIMLKLKIKGYESTFNVPIALKAAPHFLRSDDLAALFDSAIEDKRLLTRIVKLSSGEISFFKDFIFNMDRIKRDQELYKAFGQHPWYQQFIARKEKNRAKRAGLIAASLFGKGKEVVSATSNYLPTASIVLTLDELERSSKMKYGFLLKNEKIMWSILNHLGLLCIAVYIPETESYSFYFNGFKKPLNMRKKDVKGDSGKDSTDKMVDLMTLMMKRGVM